MIRIVKMTFRRDAIATFREIFNTNAPRIRGFKGCTYLELWQDKDDPRVHFTHSHWNGTDDLENYRNSEFFKTTWAETKELFEEKPVAWSVDSKVLLE